MSANYGNKIGRATVWSSVTEVVTKLITPVVNMVLARLLVPEAFGVVATITMIISFAELFTDAGFQKYIVQHEFETKDDLNKSTTVAFWTNFSISILACLIIFIFRHQIATIVGNPGLGNSISVASLLIIIAAFSSIQMARYKRNFDFKTLFFVRIGSSLMPLIITIPLAVWLRNYWALLIGTFARHLFNAMVLTWKSEWKPTFYYSFKRLKEMFSFTAWTLLESISIWLTTNIGVFIVGTFLHEYYLGLYKTTMSTINAYMAIITSAITPVMFSALSRYQNDESLFKKTFYTFQKLTALFVFPMGVGIYLFSDLVTEILLGEQWLEASGFIGLWGLTSAITIVFSNFSSEVYRSKGNPKLSLFSQLLHLVFLIPVLIISARHGFQVLYITRSIIRLQMVITAIILLQAIYKLKFADTLKNVLPAIVATVIMGCVGYFLMQFNNGMLWQFSAIFICIIVYFISLFLLFPSVWHKDVKPLLNKALSKIKRD